MGASYLSPSKISVMILRVTHEYLNTFKGLQQNLTQSEYRVDITYINLTEQYIHFVKQMVTL